MSFSIVIPSRWDRAVLTHIFWSLAQQTKQPDALFLVVPAHANTPSFQEYIRSVQSSFSCPVTLLTTSPEYSSSASFARNYGIQHVQTPYVYLLDDDNICDPSFLEQSLQEYETYVWKYQTPVLYAPTVYYRTKERIQSRWIKAFHYLLWWPEPVYTRWWKPTLISFFRFLFPVPSFFQQFPDYTRAIAIGGNSLYSQTRIFQDYLFDEAMPFVYEDIDFSFRVTQGHIPLLISHSVGIYHQERDKTLVEQSFLGSAAVAYEKAKNRILFVRKNGTWYQKVLFFVFWFPVTSVRMSFFILLHTGPDRWKILHSYFMWICAGINK